MGSVMAPMATGTYSGIAFFSPTFSPSEWPELSFLLSHDRSDRHGAQLWQSWLLGVSPRLTGTPWKVAAGDLAINDLETSLGTYPLHNESAWCPDCRTTAWNPSHILTKRLLERGVLHVPLLVCLMTCVGDMRWGHVQDLDGRLYGSSHFSLHLWTPANCPKC